MSNFDRVVDAARDFACDIYRNQPGALVKNPISDVLKFAWDDLCSNNTLPPPPAVPFSGGQCDAVVYDVGFTILSSIGNASDSRGAYGPIGGMRVRLVPDGLTTFRASYDLYCRNLSGPSAGGLKPPGWYEVGSNPGMPPDTSIRIDSISRRDGQPDACGDPPAKYPDAPPPPPGGYVSNPTTINYNDGTDFTTVFNLNPPQDDTAPPPDICLSVNIKGVVVELCFPPDALPNFGGGGGDFDEIKNLLNMIQSNINNLQNDVDNVQDDVDNLQNDFDKFTDPPPPASDPDLNQEDFDDPDGGEHDNLPGLKWVVVSLTTLPVKAQFGTPSVNFAGWLTFKVGSDYTDRVPIAFESGVFHAPPGATGYAITYTNKAAGLSKAFIQPTTP